MNTTHPQISVKKALGWAAAGVGVVLVTRAIFRVLGKYNLQGKVVLITGGSRGLGLVLARELAAKGAKIALCARSADKLELARQELQQRGAAVLTIPADITDRVQAESVVRDVIDHYNALDIVINNAGIIQVGPQETMDISDYEKAMQTNFWAALYIIRAALPHFMSRGGGRIVNITSIGGKIAVPHILPYTASKFALVGLSEGLATELKKHNIHVTTVVPNLMRTGSQRNVTVKGNHKAEYAWFKLSGSSPLLTQSAEHVARSVVKAIEYGDSEATLSLSGKVATVVKGIAPGWVNALMTLANKILPDATGNSESKMGYEAESMISQSPLASLTNKAAAKNNEL